MAADNELLRRYAETRSEEAFAAVVNQYLGLVYYTVLRRLNGDRPAAEDVTQVVFTDLARKADALCHHPTLASWLHTSARYAAAKYRRAEATRRRQESEAETMNKILSSESNRLDWVQVRPHLDDLLGALREGDRAAVLLRCFDSLPFTEVGAALGISSDAARMRVDRALTKMRRGLEKRGISSTAAAFAAILTEANVGVPSALAGTIAGRTVEALNSFSPMQLLLGRFWSAPKFSMVAGLSMAVSGGMIGSAWIKLHRIQVEVATVQQALAQSLAEQARDTQNFKKVSEEASRIKAQLSDLKKPSVGPTSTNRFQTADEAVEQGNAFMLRHPAVRHALENYGHARVRWQYGTALAELHLPPDKLKEVLSVLERGRSMGAANGTGGQISLSAGSGPYSTVQEKEQAIVALVGPEGRIELYDYQQLDAARDLSGSLAGALWDSRDPLTPAQSQQLTQLFGRRANRQVDWDSVMKSAPGILSPGQLSVLDGIKAEKEFDLAVGAAWSK